MDRGEEKISCLEEWRKGRPSDGQVILEEVCWCLTGSTTENELCAVLSSTGVRFRVNSEMGGLDSFESQNFKEALLIFLARS